MYEYKKGISKVKNCWILLDSRCSPKIIMGRLVKKLSPRKDAVIQWHMQAGNITTNLKIEVNFTLPELSAADVVICIFFVDESAKDRYNGILGRGFSPKIRIISYLTLWKFTKKNPTHTRWYRVSSAVLDVLTSKEIPLAFKLIKTRCKNETVRTWFLPPGFI